MTSAICDRQMKYNSDVAPLMLIFTVGPLAKYSIAIAHTDSMKWQKYGVRPAKSPNAEVFSAELELPHPPHPHHNPPACLQT